MQEKRINALLVVDRENRLIGALNMHDLCALGSLNQVGAEPCGYPGKSGAHQAGYFDVDGVLTDGKLFSTKRGEDTRDSIPATAWASTCCERPGRGRRDLGPNFQSVTRAWRASG